eukprot:COSAG06_NODE_4837_length_3918_cov_2.033246_2_plen_183_part_01
MSCSVDFGRDPCALIRLPSRAQLPRSLEPCSATHKPKSQNPKPSFDSAVLCDLFRFSPCFSRVDAHVACESLRVAIVAVCVAVDLSFEFVVRGKTLSWCCCPSHSFSRGGGRQQQPQLSAAERATQDCTRYEEHRGAEPPATHRQARKRGLCPEKFGQHLQGHLIVWTRDCLVVLQIFPGPPP